MQNMLTGLLHQAARMTVMGPRKSRVTCRYDGKYEGDKYEVEAADKLQIFMRTLCVWFRRLCGARQRLRARLCFPASNCRRLRRRSGPTGRFQYVQPDSMQFCGGVRLSCNRERVLVTLQKQMGHGG